MSKEIAKAKAKVLLLEPTHMDISDAKNYGTVEFLMKRRINPFDNARLVEAISDSLNKSGFHHEVDYLCMTGNALAIAFLLSVASAMFPSIQLLLFDAGTGKYRKRIHSTTEVNYEPETNEPDWAERAAVGG